MQISGVESNLEGIVKYTANEASIPSDLATKLEAKFPKSTIIIITVPNHIQVSPNLDILYV